MEAELRVQIVPRGSGPARDPGVGPARDPGVGPAREPGSGLARAAERAEEMSRGARRGGPFDARRADEAAKVTERAAHRRNEPLGPARREPRFPPEPGDAQRSGRP